MRPLLTIFLIFALQPSLAAQQEHHTDKKPGYEKYLIPAIPSFPGWKHLISTSSTHLYYSPSRIKTIGKATTFWAKEVAREGSTLEVIKEALNIKGLKNEDDYARFHHRLTYFQFDCNRESYILVDYLDYSTRGSLFFRLGKGNDDWSEIIPDSYSEKFFSIACKNKPRQKTKNF